MMHQTQQVGVVAIGRNEGERLKLCLTAAVAQAPHVVYVDSGSTDGSVEFARSLGVEVVELDLSIPFTAARARNAGFHRLVEVEPDLAFVQFVDGDCELVDGYIVKALASFEGKDKGGIVSGRRRERHPGATIYNRLCDMEWDTPIGEAAFCHGDATMRRAAFEQAGTFDETMIAGEEPELCERLKNKGWTIERIDAEMTLHDAAITRFGQWYKRMVRAGHAYAELAQKHGKPPERLYVRDVVSSLVMGFGMPVFAVVCLLAAFVFPLAILGSVLVVLMLMVKWAKIIRWRKGTGDTWSDAMLYSTATMLAKLPEAIGILKYHRDRRSGKQSRLIEYKSEGALRG